MIRRRLSELSTERPDESLKRGETGRKNRMQKYVVSDFGFLIKFLAYI